MSLYLPYATSTCTVGFMYLFLPALTPILVLIASTQTNTTPYVVVSGVDLISDTFTVCIWHTPISWIEGFVVRSAHRRVLILPFLHMEGSHTSVCVFVCSRFPSMTTVGCWVLYTKYIHADIYKCIICLLTKSEALQRVLYTLQLTVLSCCHSYTAVPGNSPVHRSGTDLYLWNYHGTVLGIRTTVLRTSTS